MTSTGIGLELVAVVVCGQCAALLVAFVTTSAQMIFVHFTLFGLSIVDLS